MKKLAMKKICSLLLVCSMLLTASSGTMAAAKPEESPSAAYQFLNDPLQGETGVISVTYDAMDYEGETPTNQKDNLRWRESMVTGNGKIALLESCNPLSDVMIFQNTKFNMPNNDRMDTPALYEKLDEMRQAMVEDPYAASTEGKVWKIAEAEAKKSWGLEKWPYGYDYSFHPGNQLRVDMEGRGEAQNYKRWTNYEKAEIGVGFEDEAGVWLRRTFASRADNVIITEYTQSSEGEKLSLTLSLDDISSIPLESGTIPDVRYKELVPEDASYIGQVAHYPEFANSFLKEGGYAGVTRVLTDGEREKIVLEPTDAKNIGEKAAIQITDAEKVILITALDRTVDMGSMEEFAQTDSYELVDELCEQIAEVEKTYTENTSADFSYDDALAAHTEIHAPLFNGVKLNLNGNEADRALPNEALLKKQRANKTTLYPAMIERAFNAGRYAAICASGYSTTRLGGIWTGVFNPNWQGDYTTDANVNLQVSAANVGSMKTFGRGYIDFMLRIVDDFQYNAEQIYGMKDAIMASGRTDGENGFIYHINAGNPFFCWNAGTDWQLLPIYEYWQCYGNEIIPAGEDVDVDSLAEVLDLDEADVNRVKAEGFNLEEDILWPLLRKHAHFWEQFVDPRYYMDAQGKTCYDPEHTALAEGERYMFLPSYSPENHPKKPNEDVVQINSTMDIAAARDGLDMAIAMAGVIGDRSEVEKWQDLKAKLPEYKYQKQGDLMEWSLDECEGRENYGHRHFSHLYPVWPGYEAEDNMELKAGAELTMELKARDGKNSQQSHGWMHKGLGEARLKNGQGIIDSLKPGMTGKIYHTSMTTAHNVNGGSAYCTDTQIGMVGIVQEGLLFSRTGNTTDGLETENDGNRNGEIELLPALPEEWDTGSITGLNARTQATVDSLAWNLADGKVEAEITSHTDQTITLKCGVAWDQVTINGKTPELNPNGNACLVLKEGETIKAVFSQEKQILTVQYGANAKMAAEGKVDVIIERDGMFGAAVQAGEEIRLTFTPVDGPFAGATLNGEEIPFEADGFTYTFVMPKDKISLRFAFTTINKDILKTLINKADEVSSEQLEKLVPSVRKKFIAARDNAQAVYENSAATQDEVNKAWKELLNMMHYLSFEEGTKDKLEYWLDYASMLDLEAFTPASQEGYAEALAYAEEIFNDEGETLKAEVEKAVNYLYDAIMRLKHRANTETLEFFVKEAQEINLDKYMDGLEKDRFSELLPQAEELLADGNATQEQVSKMAELLREAIENLRLTPSREALKDLLDESEALDPDDYTQKSYATLRTSLDDAWDTYNNEDATPEEVSSAIASILKARNSLLPAEKPEEPIKPTKPSKPTSSSSGSISNAYGNAGSAVAVTGAAAQKSVHSDTTVDFILKRGDAYCFKMTVLNGNATAPDFTVGNGNVLKTQFVARIGNAYYYRVWAVGAPGQSTGVYTTMPGETAQKHCTVTIS